MIGLLQVKYISKQKGKGVFANRDIPKGTIVDIAHIIPILNKEYKKIKKTVLYNYAFVWEDPKYFPEYKFGITLSISQFINHSYEPNIKYEYDYDDNTIKYRALENIPKGKELLVNYNGNLKDKSPVWFDME